MLRMTATPALDILRAKTAGFQNFWHPPTIMQNSPLLAKFLPGAGQQGTMEQAQTARLARSKQITQSIFPGVPSVRQELRDGGFRPAPGMGG
jgi:hypothetical protein